MTRSGIALRPLLVLTALLAVLASAAPALADLVTWNLNVTLQDGGAATGYFKYDTAAAAITHWSFQATVVDPDAINPGGWPPSWPTITSPFTFADGGAGQYVSIGTLPSDELLLTFAYVPTTLTPEPQLVYMLDFTAPTGDFPPFIGLNTPNATLYCPVGPTGTEPQFGGEYQFGLVSSNYPSGGMLPLAMDPMVQGTLSSVPLPPSALLLGAGLIGLAVARCRKRWGK
jgi:hypothetical protein